MAVVLLNFATDTKDGGAASLPVLGPFPRPTSWQPAHHVLAIVSPAATSWAEALSAPNGSMNVKTMAARPNRTVAMAQVPFKAGENGGYRVPLL
jgi:hypothetical protein